MAKQKIADLPQEEQDKITNEMKELGIGGVYATYTVEKAKAAIEKKKAEKAAAENKPETEGDGANVTPDNPDDKNEGEQIVAGDGGVFDENGEKPDGETSNPENPENPENPSFPRIIWLTRFAIYWMRSKTVFSPGLKNSAMKTSMKQKPTMT